MYISKIHIKNFKTIKDLLITVNKKIVILSGRNGQGKTSVLSALTYVLTDTLDEKISEYVNWYADSFYIEIDFTHRNISYNYIVEGGKRSNKTLVINGDTENPLKNSDAVKKMHELFDPKLMLYSSIVKQKESSKVLFESSSQRLQNIKNILKFDRIDRIAKTMFDDISELQEKVKNNKLEIDILKKREYKFLEIPDQVNVAAFENKYKELSLKKNEYNSQKILYEQYTKDLKNYFEYLEEKKLSEIELVDINTKILGYREEIKEIDIKLSEYTDINFREKIFELNNINTKLSQLIKQILDIEVDINKKNTEISNIKIIRIPACKYTKEQLQEQRELLTHHSSQIISLTKDLKLILQGKCSECGRDYEGDPSKIEELIKLENDKKKEISILISEIENEIKAYDKSVSDNEYNKKTKATLENDLTNLNSKLTTLNQEYASLFIDNIDTTITDLNTKEGNYNKLIQDKNTLLTKIHNYEKDIKNIEDKLSKIVNEPIKVNDPIKFNEEEFLKAEQDFFAAKTQNNSRLQAIAHNDNIKIEKQDNENKILLLEKDNDTLNHTIYITQTGRQLLEKHFSSYLIEKNTRHIVGKMNEFFARIYGRYYVTFKQDKKSLDFFYTPDNEIIASIGVAGGFEQQVLAISFILGLATLQDSGLLVLDEIDNDAEVKNSLKLYDNIVKQEFNQIFCITHYKDTIEHLQNNYEVNLIEF